MSSKVFRGTVLLPTALLPHGLVVVEQERIVAVGPESNVKVPAGAEVIDAHEGYISPGFVDIQTHGGAGSDYMDGTPEVVRISNRAHARHGTTTIFAPTLIEYVAAHELVHLLEPRHDAAFWDRPEQVLPDWKTRKRLLAESGSRY